MAAVFKNILYDMEHFELYGRLFAALSKNLKLLPDKPEENPQSTLCALWHAAAGHTMSVEQAKTEPLTKLNSMAVARLAEFVEMRLSGVPLSYLTGYQRFMGIDFVVGEEVFIPRKETEILVTEVLERVKQLSEIQEEVKIIDVCTGSGNIAISLAYFVKNVRVIASEISQDAIDLAKKNAKKVKVADRVEFRLSDLLESFESNKYYNKIDFLTCNPPYISKSSIGKMPEEIIKYEPYLAFNGGAFGIKVINRLINDAVRFLKPKGMLCFEIGKGQGDAIAKRIKKNGEYCDVSLIKDYNTGESRAIIACRK